MKQLQWNDCNRLLLLDLIRQHKAFAICGLDWSLMLDAVELMESILSTENLTWRTYTKGRVALLLSALLSKRVGLWAVIGLMTHRILTLNPDYVLCKDFTFGRLVVRRR